MKKWKNYDILKFVRQCLTNWVGLKENKRYLEKDLENALIEHIQEFLLELGKGFSFVARNKE